MWHSKNTSFPQNNPPDIEQHVKSVASSAMTSSTIGLTEPVVSQIFPSASIQEVGLLLPLVANTPPNSRVSQAVIGDPWHPYVPSFTLNIGIRDYQYGIMTAMMVGFQSHTFTFVDNSVTISSPLNQYFASVSAASSPGRMVQLQVMAALTNIAMLSTRQQMD